MPFAPFHHRVVILLLSLVFFSLQACTPVPPDEKAPTDAGDTDNDKPKPAVAFSTKELRELKKLSPLPSKLPNNPTNKVANDPKAAHFGQFLFYDKRLSSNGEISCATCHDPDKGLGDGIPLSKGVGQTPRNAPHLWNLAFNRWFFWDGRADTVWMQAMGPIESPKEMGYSRLQLAHLLRKDSALKKAYEEIFGPLPDLSDEKRFPLKGGPIGESDDPLRKAWEGMKEDDQKTINVIFSNVAKAIEAYQRKLLSKNSPFDVFVEGLKTNDASKLKALSASAQRGAQIFVGKGNCTLCHTGSNFTDMEFHNIGLALPANRTQADSGRFLGIPEVKASKFNGLGPYSDGPDDDINDRIRFVKQNSNNLGEFKTPSLRSVARTGPYMHDGRFKTLEEVVNFYNDLKDKPAIGHREESLQKLKLSDQQKKDLVAFLKSLTGKPLSAELLKQPSNPSLP